MLRRNISFNKRAVLLSSAVLLFTSGTASAAPALKLENVTAAPGGEVQLSISLNGEATGVCALDLRLNYEAGPSTAPPLQLTGLDKSRLAAPFADSMYASVGVIDPGTSLPYDLRRRIAIIHGDPVDGPADVIRLSFKVPTTAAPGTAYQVSIQAGAFDDSGRKISLDGAVGTVTVSGFQAGDVDGNGQVDVGDAVLILRYTVGLTTLPDDQLARADLDGSQTVDIADAVGVLRLAVGLGG